MSSKYRHIEHFTGEYTGSTGTSANHCSAGTENTGIRSLGAAKTEFHDRVTFCCVAYTSCFGSDKALVVNDVEDCCFYKLGFHDRCNNFYKRLSWEYNSSFRDCIDITGELEVA